MRGFYPTLFDDEMQIPRQFRDRTAIPPSPFRTAMASVVHGPHGETSMRERLRQRCIAPAMFSQAMDQKADPLWIRRLPSTGEQPQPIRRLNERFSQIAPQSFIVSRGRVDLAPFRFDLSGVAVGVTTGCIPSLSVVILETRVSSSRKRGSDPHFHEDDNKGTDES